jgi:Uma2 family endonuclease
MSIAMGKNPHQVRITVDEYHRMAEVGLLAPDARVELIEGVIVEMPPMGPRHAAAVRGLTELLARAVGSRATVSCQLPVELSEYSEPQPDLALLIRREDFYATRHPSVEDVLLVIEVSDTSLHSDLRAKAALYAQHGIPELWVIDVAGGSIHVFLHPSDATYRGAFVPEAADQMEIKALPGVVVDLSRILC